MSKSYEGFMHVANGIVNAAAELWSRTSRTAQHLTQLKDELVEHFATFSAQDYYVYGEKSEELWRKAKVLGQEEEAKFYANKAIKYYKKVTEKDSQAYIAFKKMAEIFIDLKQPLEAIECYKGAIKINKNDQALYFIVGRAFQDLCQNQDRQNAIFYQEKAIEFYNHVVTEFDYRNNKDFAALAFDAYVNMGDILYDDIQQRPLALFYYQQAMEIYGNDYKVNDSAICTMYTKMGDISYANIKIEDAHKYYVKALEIKSDIKANFGMIIVLQSLGQQAKDMVSAQEFYQKAIEYCDAVIELDFDLSNTSMVARAYVIKGDILHTIGQSEKALGCYDNVMQKYVPMLSDTAFEHHENTINIGISLQYLGLTAEAIKWYYYAASQPEFKKDAIPHLSEALLKFLQQMETGEKNDNNNSDIQRAVALLDLRRIEKAQEYLKKIIDCCPGSDAACKASILYYITLKEMEIIKTSEDLQLVIGYHVENPTPRLSLAKNYITEGDESILETHANNLQALECFEKAILLDSNNVTQYSRKVMALRVLCQGSMAQESGKETEDLSVEIKCNANMNYSAPSDPSMISIDITQVDDNGSETGEVGNKTSESDDEAGKFLAHSLVSTPSLSPVSSSGKVYPVFDEQEMPGLFLASTTKGDANALVAGNDAAKEYNVANIISSVQTADSMTKKGKEEEQFVINVSLVADSNTTDEVTEDNATNTAITVSNGLGIREFSFSESEELDLPRDLSLLSARTDRTDTSSPSDSDRDGISCEDSDTEEENGNTRDGANFLNENDEVSSIGCNIHTELETS